MPTSQKIDQAFDIFELPATKKISGQHFSGLRALKDETIIKNYYLVSEDPINRIAENFINVIHWKDFLKKLWADEIL